MRNDSTTTSTKGDEFRRIEVITGVGRVTLLANQVALGASGISLGQNSIVFGLQGYE